MPIYLAPVPDFDDEDDEPIPLDRVDDPVIAGADSEELVLTAKARDACRPRVVGEGVDPVLDSILVGPSDRFKLS